MSGCRGGFSNKERGGRSRGASYSGGGIGNVGSGWGSATAAVASTAAAVLHGERTVMIISMVCM